MRSRKLAALATFSLAVSTPGLTALTATADTQPLRPEMPATVGTKIMPAPQHNGVGWTTKIVGNVAFVGGKFTSVRPPNTPAGQKETRVSNFVAFDINTGEIIPHLTVPFNGDVKDIEVSANGKKLYVSGMFTRAGNEPRYRFASLDLTSGLLVEPAPAFDYRVEDIAVSGDTIYVGGKFSSMEGVSRQNLAAFKDDGSILPWAPKANDAVLGITTNGSKVIAGGQFNNLSGRRVNGWGALDAHSGATLPWQAQQVVGVSGRNGGIYDIDSDDNGVYVVGFSYGANTRFEGSAAASWSGSSQWVKGCRGDSYGLAADGDVLYHVHHNHDCNPIEGIPERRPRIYQRGDATTTFASPYGRKNFGLEFNGQPAPEPLHWYPEIEAGEFTGLSQGPWAVDAENGAVVITGEFPMVNGERQNGIALFKSAERGGAEAPTKTWEVRPNFTTDGRGRVTASFNSVYDRDSSRVIYQLVRDGEVVAEKKIDGRLWWDSRTRVDLVDVGAPNGTHDYLVRIVDADDNSAETATSSVNVTGAQEPSDYVDEVAADGARYLWRLNESRGTDVAYDGIGDNDLGVSWGVNREQDGALVDEDDKASALVGQNQTPLASMRSEAAPQSYASEMWFKTSTTSGGTMMAFGSNRTGHSAKRDRFVYMNNNGQLLYGVYPGRIETIKSPESYNDGQWHHVVAQVGVQGMEMFVDGELVQSNPAVTRAEDFTGYWKMGGERMWGWPERPRKWEFTGVIDEAAIYDNTLSSDQVRSHYDLGTQTTPEPNTPPEAMFVINDDELTINVNASGSIDNDGTIESYAWDFGDGSVATGPEATHTYDADGTYIVTVTVTDDDGAESVSTKKVTVSEDDVVIGNPSFDEAVDNFSGESESSWGTAVNGGNWSSLGSPYYVQRKDGNGRIRLNPALQTAMALKNVGIDSATLDSDITVPDELTGNLYVNYNIRTVGDKSYSARVKMYPSGIAQIGLVVTEGVSNRVLAANNAIRGVNPGDKINIKAEAVTTNGTTELKGKIFLDGAEPNEWQVESSDSTQELQEEGSVGITAYLSGSAREDVNILIDNFEVRQK